MAVTQSAARVRTRVCRLCKERRPLDHFLSVRGPCRECKDEIFRFGAAYRKAEPEEFPSYYQGRRREFYR